MNDYPQLTDQQLWELCVWREARGESFDAQRAVAHVIYNRSLAPAWWNHHTASIRATILQPWQFSSFNASDPQVDKYPVSTNDPSWESCRSAVSLCATGNDTDPSNGATHYYDSSLTWPAAWGNQAEWEHTADIGRLHFYRQGIAPISLDAQDL